MTFTSITLRSDVHLAWVGEDIVVLDVTGDGYACLVGATPFLRPTDRPGVLAVDPSWTCGLSAAGLTSEKSVQLDRKAVQSATGSVPIQRVTNAWALARAIGHTCVAYSLFQERSFPDLINSAARRGGSERQRPEERLAQAVGAFLVTHAWIPFEGDCLKRSFALHYHLHRCGIDADWVFGVRTWPFLAHCWVQRDGLVIGDSLDRINGFTPILTVG